MFVRALCIPFYLVTVFLLLTRIPETYCAPKAQSRKQLDITNSEGSSTKADQISILLPFYEKAIANIAELVKNYPAKLQHLKSIKKKNPRVALETLTGPSLDSATNLLTAVSNFINGRTNIEAVDKYINLFNSLMLSNGFQSTLTYTTIYMSFWVIYDATTWIYRFNERRFNDKKDQMKEELEKDDEVVEEMISTLNAANKRLKAFKNNMQLLICQNIERSAVKNGKILIKRSGLERQVDCSSILRKRIDVNYNKDNNEEKEVEANEDKKVNAEEETLGNSKAILKDAIPDEPDLSSYLNNDDEPEVANENYIENDIPADDSN